MPRQVTDEYGDWEEYDQPSGAVVRVLKRPSKKWRDEEPDTSKEPKMKTFSEKIQEEVLKMKDEGKI